MPWCSGPSASAEQQRRARRSITSPNRRIDALMARTSGRPLPSGKVDSVSAAFFAAALTIVSMTILVWSVNGLTAILTLRLARGIRGDLQPLPQAGDTAEHRDRGRGGSDATGARGGRRSPAPLTPMRCCCFSSSSPGRRPTSGHWRSTAIESMRMQRFPCSR